MKIRFGSKSGEQGTALMVTLFLCTFMLLSVVGYLMNARHQQYIGQRAQVWNMSISVAEAGIEEGLQHLNANSPNLEQGGWTRNGTTYQRAQTLSGNSRYVITINAFDINNPVLTAIGYHEAPVFGGSSAGTTGESDSTFQTSIAQSINRTIEVRATRRDGLFRGALIAKEGVDLNGNGVSTDSFDSNNPLYSNSGRYPAGNLAKLRSNGDVYVNSSLLNAANVGNSDIHGCLVVGPGGLPNLGPNGGVGSYPWRLAGNNGIQKGYFRDDSNFTFPDVEIPYTFGATPTPGTVSTTNITVSSGTTTTANYPSPAPASGVITNISYATTSVQPSPVPSGMVVNTLTTYSSSSSYPAPGTYVGEVRRQGSQYYYNRITGSSYTYPVYTYSYNTYTTNYVVTSRAYDYIINGGHPSLAPVNYYVDEIEGSVFVRGNARLVVRDGFSGEIFINSDGKLEAYVGGSSISVSGNGVINDSGYAANCIIWCTASVTSMDFSGNAEITGVIYAPQADLKLNGGGHLPFDFTGSLVVNSANLNGHFSFHYDEALRSYNSNARYLVTSWNEI